MSSQVGFLLTLKQHRLILLASIVVGYALFYATRQNLSIVMPVLGPEIGLTKEQMGMIFSTFAVIYGIGKLFNGFIADKFSPRLIFVIGLLGSSLFSMCYVLNTGLVWFLVVAALSAWFQSMGWPPITKLLTSWYPRKELGVKWGIANTSHQLGSVCILAAGPYILASYGWKQLMVFPAILGIALAGVLYVLIKDSPQKAGIEYDHKKEEVIEEHQIPLRIVLRHYLIPNARMWFVCLATFFLYVVRIGFFFWAPLFLKEVKGVSLIEAGWVTAGIELAGAFGGVFAGYISDKKFPKQRGLVGAAYMFTLLLFLFYFWITKSTDIYELTFVTFFVGFFIYGSQVLTGVLAADVVPKHIVGSAVGLTGTFGYLAGSIFSGVVIGHIAHYYGWHTCFLLFVVSAFLGTLFFLLTALTQKRISDPLHLKKNR
jgi:sugar phosphate permease